MGSQTLSLETILSDSPFTRTLDTLNFKVREGGEAKHYFYIVKTIIRWFLLDLAAYLDGRDWLFCCLKLWFLIDTLPNQFQFETESLEKLVSSWCNSNVQLLSS